MTRPHPIRALLARKVKGHDGDPVTLRIRLREFVCDRRGHRPEHDTHGYRYCGRCFDTLPEGD